MAGSLTMPGGPRTKGNARPILGKKIERGLQRLAGSVVPTDPETFAALQFIRDLLAWHNKPDIAAKRKSRGQSVKNWSLKSVPNRKKTP